MKNKKGFTLIEVLAVIVILAIILVIATTQIPKAVNSSRNEAFLTSYENIIDDVKARIVQKKTNKSVEIECTDLDEADLSEAYEDLSSCSELYEISSDDYILSVLKVNSNYLIVMDGIGKFESVNLSEKHEKLINDNIYPLGHGFSDASDIKNNALTSMVSSYGKIINVKDELDFE